jgi:Etoposide-induced protein 2.4 (EI24)
MPGGRPGYAAAMRSILDAFWRAAVYCLHPRVIALSLLPIVVAGGLAFVLGFFYWESAVDGVRVLLDQWELGAPVLEWANRASNGMFRTVIGPLVVTVLSVPVLLIVSLLLVSFMMGPALVDLVAQRRFATLERRRGAGAWYSALRSFGVTLMAVVMLVATLPLWLIPPLALLLPPLLWGWLCYRIMAFDAIAAHADAAERRLLLRGHRWSLFGIGVVAGYLGAVPSMALIAFGAMTLPLAPVALPVFVWLYTLVFAFTLLWFAHFGLAALQRLRRAPVAALPGSIASASAEGTSPAAASASANPASSALPPRSGAAAAPREPIFDIVDAEPREPGQERPAGPAGPSALEPAGLAPDRPSTP